MTKNTEQQPEIPTETAEPAAETIDDLRAEIGRLRLHAARESIVRRLEAAGARSPELLFPTISGKLHYAADGSVENEAALIELLKREMPEQFGSSASVDGGSGVSSGVRPLTREALARMSPEQISRLDWAAVRQVLSRS